ncbi:MAG: hypothetical protein NC206_10335 [Bacteroides sp.]|nr:hypothetical protein [Roseburia sp.]MCM1347465.1 hypothetical protein [Bacteroides sp.]MCM1421930.1 hypothetical protein [Bacteroides sp.]
MKKIIILTLLIGVILNIHAQKADTHHPVPSATERITDFYHKWLHDDTSGQRASLEDEYLTSEMRRKWRRIATVYGCDPFLRAQDYTEYTAKSLQCTH